MSHTQYNALRKCHVYFTDDDSKSDRRKLKAEQHGQEDEDVMNRDKRHALRQHVVSALVMASDVVGDMIWIYALIMRAI